MKKFLLAFLFIFVYANVFAQDWLVSQNVEFFEDDENIIHENVVLNQTSNDVINVADTITVWNYGTINGSLVASEDNLIRIQNSGIITGRIEAARVIQIVTGASDLQQLNIQSDNFSVFVDGMMSGIDLADLQSLNSNQFEFHNAGIFINDFTDWQNWDVDIEWSGTNRLYIRQTANLQSGDITNNINNSDVQFMLIKDSDWEDVINNPYVEHWENGAVLNIVTENDYEQIFGAGAGSLLEDIRNTNPGDRLLRALDSVNNINDLRNIGNASYRFNPSVLMRPVVAMNNFSVLDNLFVGDTPGAGIMPVYIGSEYVHNRGLRLYTDAFQNEKVSVNFGLRLNSFDYTDDLNDFSGIAYGADINAAYKKDDFIIKGYLGFNLVDFKADHIYINGDVKNNPFGYSVYGGFDGVYDYAFSENIHLMPFGGIVFQHYSILSSDDYDLNLRGGGALKYDFTVDGIKYEYGFGAGVVSNADVFGVARFGFNSLVDNIGAFLNFGVIKDDYVWNYQIAADVKISF